MLSVSFTAAWLSKGTMTPALGFVCQLLNKLCGIIHGDKGDEAARKAAMCVCIVCFTPIITNQALKFTERLWHFVIKP